MSRRKFARKRIAYLAPIFRLGLYLYALGFSSHILSGNLNLRPYSSRVSEREITLTPYLGLSWGEPGGVWSALSRERGWATWWATARVLCTRFRVLSGRVVPRVVRT